MKGDKLVVVILCVALAIVLIGWISSSIKCKGLASEKAALEEKVTTLTSTVDTLQQEKASLTSAVETLTNEKKALKAEYDKLLDEKISLQAEFDKAAKGAAAAVATEKP